MGRSFDNLCTPNYVFLSGCSATCKTCGSGDSVSVLAAQQKARTESRDMLLDSRRLVVAIQHF